MDMWISSIIGAMRLLSPLCAIICFVYIFLIREISSQILSWFFSNHICHFMGKWNMLKLNDALHILYTWVTRQMSNKNYSLLGGWYPRGLIVHSRSMDRDKAQTTGRMILLRTNSPAVDLSIQTVHFLLRYCKKNDNTMLYSSLNRKLKVWSKP